MMTIQQSIKPDTGVLQHELLKLDTIDRKVAGWLRDNEPKALFHYLNEAAVHYRAKGIELNTKDIYMELVGYHPVNLYTVSAFTDREARF